MLGHTESVNKFRLPGGYADKPTSVARTKAKDGARQRSTEGVIKGFLQNPHFGGHSYPTPGSLALRSPSNLVSLGSNTI